MTAGHQALQICVELLPILRTSASLWERERPGGIAGRQLSEGFGGSGEANEPFNVSQEGPVGGAITVSGQVMGGGAEVACSGVGVGAGRAHESRSDAVQLGSGGNRSGDSGDVEGVIGFLDPQGEAR